MRQTQTLWFPSLPAFRCTACYAEMLLIPAQHSWLDNDLTGSRWDNSLTPGPSWAPHLHPKLCVRVRLRAISKAWILSSHFRVINNIWTLQSSWSIELEVLRAPGWHIRSLEGMSISGKVWRAEEAAKWKGSSTQHQVLKERPLDHIQLSVFAKKGPLADKTWFFISQEWGLSAVLYLKSSGPPFLLLQSLQPSDIVMKERGREGLCKRGRPDSRKCSSSGWKASKAVTHGPTFPPYNNRPLVKEQQVGSGWVSFLCCWGHWNLCWGLLWLTGGWPSFYSIKCPSCVRASFDIQQGSLPCGRWNGEFSPLSLRHSEGEYLFFVGISSLLRYDFTWTHPGVWEEMYLSAQTPPVEMPNGAMADCVDPDTECLVRILSLPFTISAPHLPHLWHGVAHHSALRVV